MHDGCWPDYGGWGRVGNERSDGPSGELEMGSYKRSILSFSENLFFHFLTVKLIPLSAVFLWWSQIPNSASCDECCDICIKSDFGWKKRYSPHLNPPRAVLSSNGYARDLLRSPWLNPSVPSQKRNCNWKDYQKGIFNGPLSTGCMIL